MVSKRSKKKNFNHIFCHFLFAQTFAIYYLLSLLHLYVYWGRSKWLADPRKILRVRAPTGSLSCERSKVYRQKPVDWSDRLPWPRVLLAINSCQQACCLTLICSHNVVNNLMTRCIDIFVYLKYTSLFGWLVKYIYSIRFSIRSRLEQRHGHQSKTLTSLF
jgi:hypothetical protein